MVAAERYPVAVAGLGDMGGALAGSLAEKGWPVTVWNRTAAKAGSLGRKGATVAGSVAEAAEAGDVLVVCLSDHAATMAAIATDAVGRALAGKAMIQLSTMTSGESRELAGWAEGHGIGFLDGQILDFPDDVREGRANIVCSGPEDLFRRHEAMLVAMAGRAPFVAERIGAAPAFDKAHLSFAMGAYLAFVHGAAMCHAAGVPPAFYRDYNLNYLAQGTLGREL